MRFNLMLTMVLGGLWHGAAWKFILWGTLHGTYLSVERVFLDRMGPSSRVMRGLGRIWVFHVVCFSWILFRSTDMTYVKEMLGGLFRGGEPVLLTPQAVVVLGMGFCMQFLDAARPARLQNRIGALPGWLQGLTAAVILVIILGLGPLGVAPFIYFQF